MPGHATDFPVSIGESSPYNFLIEPAVFQKGREKNMPRREFSRL
jgi:hypothetical protein